MANHPSAEKRNRQRLRRTKRNQGIRSAVRTAVKKARAALLSGEQDAAAQVKAASVALAKAASRGVVHPRQAARKASRMQQQVLSSAGKQ